MSDTPMTDINLWIEIDSQKHQLVLADFARDLERQLAAAHADITRQASTLTEQATEIETLKSRLANANHWLEQGRLRFLNDYAKQIELTDQLAAVTAERDRQCKLIAEGELRIDSLQREYPTALIDAFSEANRKLTAELAAAREDAERYRWLREHYTGIPDCIGTVVVSGPLTLGMDAAIDAARKESNNAKG